MRFSNFLNSKKLFSRKLSSKELSSKKLFLPILLLFISLSLCFGSSRALATERDITKTVLPNGLTVILEQDHSAPVVSLQMWVRVGSADETNKISGIAHVFEHMLFKGTERRGVGDIPQEVDAAGGYINAYTSFDTTVYHLAVASRYFSKGLDILSDAIQNSAFDPVELEKELEVVKEEIRMGEDNPGRKLYKTIFSTAYDKHTYKRPVIGTNKSVGGLTRKVIVDFFSSWYIPGNMTLVIVGDFDKTEALEEVRESFKGFKAGKDLHKPRPVEPPQKGLKTIITPQTISQTKLALAFHIPELKHPDTYSVDVISSILSGGVNSRLYKRLKTKDELVHSISAYAMTPKDPGLFLITATLETENTDKAIAAIIDELTRLGAKGPTTRELEKSKLSLESDFVYARETMTGKARQLGYYETGSGDLEFEKKYVEGIKAVDASKVTETSKKYFTLDNMTVSVLVPESEKTLISKTAVIKTVKEAVASSQNRFDGQDDEVAEDITKVTLNNGITLLVKEDHSNSTVAFYGTFPGGLRYETPETNGIGNFMAGMLSRGTTLHTREALGREAEDMAGGVGGFSAKNSTGVSGKFLSKFFDKGLSMFAEVLTSPIFPEDEIEKLRKDTLAAIERDEDYMPGYTFKLMYKDLFADHPYAMPVKGTLKTVEAFKREDIVRHYESLIVPEKMILSVVGDVSTEYVIERITETFKDFQRSAGDEVELEPATRPQGIVETGDTKHKAQTNIAIAFLGPRITDKDVYAVNVLNEVLSAHGGRLFTELRDRQSLAYAVTSFARPGIEPGAFAVYIGCAPDKKDQAIAGIIEELEKVINEEITSEELGRAKSAIVGGYEMGLQRVSTQASGMATNELLGLGHDHYKRYPELINSVSAGDVQDAAKKYITLENYVISIVGPDGSEKGTNENKNKGNKNKGHH